MIAIDHAGDDVLDHNIIIVKGVSGFYLKLGYHWLQKCIMQNPDDRKFT